MKNSIYAILTSVVVILSCCTFITDAYANQATTEGGSAHIGVTINSSGNIVYPVDPEDPSEANGSVEQVIKNNNIGGITVSGGQGNETYVPVQNPGTGVKDPNSTTNYPSAYIGEQTHTEGGAPYIPSESTDVTISFVIPKGITFGVIVQNNSNSVSFDVRIGSQSVHIGEKTSGTFIGHDANGNLVKSTSTMLWYTCNSTTTVTVQGKCPNGTPTWLQVYMMPNAVTDPEP